MEADSTRSVDLVNALCSRWSDSLDMTPWTVIEKTCIHRRIQNWQSWLAEELGMSVARVNNWKRRGVPPAKYRDIAEALSISLEQLEGIDPLPWDDAEPTQLPFTDELRRKLVLLSDVKLSRLENVMRSHLGMPTVEIVQKDDAAAEQHSSVNELVTGVNTNERGKRHISTPSLAADLIKSPSGGGGKKGVR